MSGEEMDISSRQETLNKPSREKYWSELETDQQIERMRQIVKRLSDQFEMAQQVLTSMRSAFQIHEHLNGRVFVPMPHPGGYETPTPMGFIGGRRMEHEIEA